VVTHYLDVFRTCRRPAEADTPLIIDANAVLAGSIAFQRFQSVARWDPQIIQAPCDLQLSEFSSSNRSDVYKPPDALTRRNQG